ncbi:MAG: hypothetical protein KGI27_00820 [Thaumarchaeota archaeon]|nr:hypothetical protein [Nitrososphaerota archaeon]
MNNVHCTMSTYDASGRVQQRKRHDGYLPIAVAIMLACCFVTIFGINAQAGGYGGGNNPVAFYESAGLIVAGVMIGYVALVFRVNPMWNW